MKRVIVIGCLIILVSAWLLQWIWTNRTLPGKGKHLGTSLPQQIAGWQGRDVPLGPTEAIEGQVEETLRYDDVYSREFVSSGRVVGLYVAYWEPGKMPVQLVASHTPDRCWSGAGWTCREVRHAASLDGLKPGEWRDFAAPNAQPLNVMFWHMIGSGLYDFGDRFTEVPHPVKWWRDVIRQIVTPPQEQYFVRLTSNRSFVEIESDPGFQEIVEALARLGLSDS